MKIGICLVILSAIMSISHALAQEADRTKESAITLLDMALPGLQFRGDIYDGKRTKSGFRRFGNIKRDIQEANDKCKFRYIVDYPYYEDDWLGKKYTYNADVLKKSIDFSIVSKIQRTRDEVTLYYIRGDKWNTFFFRSEQVAMRVADTMEFLRQQCDAAAATGF